MINLKEKQEELDRKKFQSSLTVRYDMSGKMEYCSGCILRNDKHECEIPHEIRKDYNVCARQYYKLEKEKENESRKSKKEEVTTKPRTVRKKNNG